MCWIDYQKAYDVLQYTWILETMEMTGMAKNVIGLMRNTMQSRKTHLDYFDEKVTEADIKRGIFQGESLAPPLILTALIPLSVLMREAAQGYMFRQGRRVNHAI